MKNISLWKVFKKITGRSEGVALIVTLLILLTLVLLGLALMLQTDTEHLIAVNEQDSIETFHYAEAGLNWTKRRVIDIADDDAFVDFSDLLDGPDNADSADDNLIPLRTVDLTLTETNELVDTNEQTDSVIVMRDFGDGSKKYEAFRWGIDDADVDTEWDGPRALIYVRVDDNYDEYPAANLPLVDTDQNVIATVVSEYPIFVNDDGEITPGTRTVARRQLKIRFGTDNAQPAILSRRSLLISGTAGVCGECGSVHANENIYGGGDIKVCQDLTATQDPEQFDENGAVIGDEFGGGFDAIDVPVINPYDDVMVPKPSDFSTIQDFAGLDCSTSTPKYFAFVANTNKGLIFKAHWVSTARPDNSDGGWKWKLIDDLDDSSNTMLDDCGRVVCGTVNGVSVHEVGNGSCDSGENWLNDDKNDEFYGFKQGDAFTSTSNCSGDVTLDEAGPIADNDFNTPNFYCSTPNTFCATDNTIYSGAFRLLPGSFDKDTARDFDDTRFEEGKARFISTTNLTFSSLFNAVIWVYGRLDIGHNWAENSSSKICTSNSSGVLNKKCEESDSALISTVGGFFRASFIAVNSIVVSGNPKYTSATPAFPFLLIAGRDIMISGNPSSSDALCLPATSECALNAGNSANYGSIMAAHEQIKMNGNFNFDGFIIIEDAVDCSTSVAARESSTGSPLSWSGNATIHYDCVHPPNPWASKVKLTSWQEVQ
ncbi:hypothetical protein L0222_31395 [bacterium]|nr:hypothetical protein [bacterium]